MMPSEKERPQVGQVLYSLNVGNAARNMEQKLTPVTVVKVGRKYFQVQGKGRLPKKFNLEDWSEATEYSPTAQLYTSEQAWIDKQEAKAITARARKAFGWGAPAMSLDALRQIAAILNEQEQPNER